MVDCAKVGMSIGLVEIAGRGEPGRTLRRGYLRGHAYAIGHSVDAIRDWRIFVSFMINLYKDYTYIYLY